jgi:hypothetical protein
MVLAAQSSDFLLDAAKELEPWLISVLSNYIQLAGVVDVPWQPIKGGVEAVEGDQDSVQRGGMRVSFLFLPIEIGAKQV